MNGVKQQGYQIIRQVFSGDEIREFGEEADRVAGEAGSVCVRRLMERSSKFAWLSRSARLAGLLGNGMRPVRSILFDKTADANWPVAWHQDLTIAVRGRTTVPGYGPWSIKDGVPHVQPPLSLLQKMLTARIHLDVTDESNGALQVIPRSHQSGRVEPGKIVEFFSGVFVSCECAPGDVLLMSPLILHASKKASKPSRRRILHFEYAGAEILPDGLEWWESEVTSICDGADM